MRFFRRDKDAARDGEDGPRPAARSPTAAFLSRFNGGAAACVALPLLLLLIRAVRDGGGGGAEDWFRRDGAPARGCAYLWSLASCAALVRFVNGLRLVASTEAERPLGGLTALLKVPCNSLQGRPVTSFAAVATQLSSILVSST